MNKQKSFWHAHSEVQLQFEIRSLEYNLSLMDYHLEKGAISEDEYNEAHSKHKYKEKLQECKRKLEKLNS